MKYILPLLLIISLLSCKKEMIDFNDDVIDVNPPITSSLIASVVLRPKVSIQLLLNLDPGPENTADGVVILYDPQFLYTIGNEDSYKWTNPDENLAINEKGIFLSIEGKPLSLKDSTFLNIWKFRQTNYYLKITTSNFPAGYSSTIWDRYLHKSKSINICGTTIINFTAKDSIPFRYKLYIKKT